MKILVLFVNKQDWINLSARDRLIWGKNINNEMIDSVNKIFCSKKQRVLSDTHVYVYRILIM